MYMGRLILYIVNFFFVFLYWLNFEICILILNVIFYRELYNLKICLLKYLFIG